MDGSTSGGPLRFDGTGVGPSIPERVQETYR